MSQNSGNTGSLRAPFVFSLFFSSALSGALLFFGAPPWVTGFLPLLTFVAIAWALTSRALNKDVASIESELSLEKVDSIRKRSFSDSFKDSILRSVSSFIDGIIKITLSTASIIDKNSISLAKISFNINTGLGAIRDILSNSNSALVSSENIRTSSELMSSNAEKAAQIVSEAEKKSVHSRDAIHLAIENMKKMQQSVQSVSMIASGLNKKSEEITQITFLVKEIADQTNLLALNAAIEAARAGEQGRGFAVVADEVRKLAERTAAATAEITSTAISIGQDTQLAAEGMSNVATDIEKRVAEVNTVGKDYVEILNNIHQVSDIIHDVSQQAIQNSVQIVSVNDYIRNLNERASSATALMEDVSTQMISLSGIGEDLHEALSDINKDSDHMDVFEIAQNASHSITAILEDAIRIGKLSESSVFDRNYKEIKGTNPQKYSTAYDRFTDTAFPAIQEPILSMRSNIVYAGAVDVNGYFPTHNKKFSKPLTGNFEVDLAGNRTKRIFDDHTGSRCGSHTKKFLLQTYMRDTGEVMHDLSVPIYVNGRHWGGFRVGYLAKNN